MLPAATAQPNPAVADACLSVFTPSVPDAARAVTPPGTGLFPMRPRWPRPSEIRRRTGADSHLKRENVLATLAKARYQQSIIDAISRPAEAKPWKDYRPIFVTDRRIDDGVAGSCATNAALLKRIEKRVRRARR